MRSAPPYSVGVSIPHSPDAVALSWIGRSSFPGQMRVLAVDPAVTQHLLVEHELAHDEAPYDVGDRQFLG